MDGSLASSFLSLATASHGVFSETEQVSDHALIQLDACGVNGALIEGLKLPVAEVAPDRLGLIQLPRLQLSHVERGKCLPTFPCCPVPLPSCALLEWLACSIIPMVELHQRVEGDLSDGAESRGQSSCTEQCVNHARHPQHPHVSANVAIIRWELYRTSPSYVKRCLPGTRLADSQCPGFGA